MLVICLWYDPQAEQTPGFVWLFIRPQITIVRNWVFQDTRGFYCRLAGVLDGYRATNPLGELRKYGLISFLCEFCTKSYWS